MDKNVSIVKVDKRNYRVIAQENWGLTKAQMKGNHVHHRIRRSDGGTNDPSNLYVCSPLYHDVVWHGGTGGFIGLAAEGGKIGGKKVHEAKDENGKSLVAVKAGRNGGSEGVRRRSGIHDPAYRSSEEYIQMRKEESKKYADRKEGMFDPGFKQKLKQKLSKPLTFHHPDGQSVTFLSRMEAIRQTNISSSTLARVLLSGQAIKAGPLKGVRITEAEG